MTARHLAESSTGDRWAWLTPARRRWAYGVALAVIALASGYGLVTDSAAALWGNLAAAVLVVAIGNTPSTEDGENGP